MRTLRSLSGLSALHTPIVLAAGVFDGVHKGHQAVIANAKARAAVHGGQAWVLTFDPHPLKILKPEAAPALLTSTPHKLSLLEALGIDGCILMPFTRELAVVEPEGFVESLRAHVPELREMVVGENWTFGHRGRGNAGMLQSLSGKLFAVTIVPGVSWNNAVISSTRIRQAVAEGKLDDAAAMLGRPFSMLGTVIHGRKVGRTLGFPTANIQPHNEVRPPAGIYAVHGVVDGAAHPGAAYVSGDPKAIGQDIVEVHLLDRTLDLYGRDLEILFSSKLRDDRRFESQEALREQISRDIDQVRHLLSP